MNHQDGFVVWFTGLSGSGKSTLATLLAAELRQRGIHVELLDGDEVRNHLSRGLGFSREDRDTNIRRIGFVAKLVARSGACAITAAISPYRDVRDEQRKAIGRFVEVYCKCPIDVLSDRDPKGLYRKALAGELMHFTGVTDPYEAPVSPDIEVDTSQSSKEQAISAILSTLDQLGYLSTKPAGRAIRYGDREPIWPPYAGSPLAETPAETAAEIPIPQGPLASILELIRDGFLSPVNGLLGARDGFKLDKEGRLESGLAFPRGLFAGLPNVSDFAQKLLILAVENGIRFHVRVDGPILFPTENAARLQAELAAAGFINAAFLLARRAMDQELALLVDLGLEACGRVVVAVAGHASRLDAARQFVSERGLDQAVRLCFVAETPVLAPDEDPLLQVIVLRNMGASFVLLDSAGAERSSPRAQLEARAKQVELGVHVVASGPVWCDRAGVIRTARMSGIVEPPPF